ncbi:hypothetical protein [Actinomadura sp. NBRC 104412]|uniref:hypothetical protein n=1 Tax=Actinomadura sp. NBRC 104412 TaxID=3032203 RepID=UPI0025553C02|nr:hypothetical protein [Actinomadura sp. NBRC 104412]
MRGVPVNRSGSSVQAVVTALVGLVSIAGACALALAGGPLYGPVPFALFGAALLVFAPLAAPPRWNAKPEERKIELGDGPVRALVIPFARWRFAAQAAFTLLVTLGGLLGVVLGLAAGKSGFAFAMGVWSLVMAPMAVLAVRRLTLRCHLAMTSDRLDLWAPGNRIRVAWDDVESVDPLPAGGRLLYGITLAPGVDAPSGRAAGRLTERFGAHVFVQADWLTVHPDDVMEAFTRHLSGEDGGGRHDGGVIG